MWRFLGGLIAVSLLPAAMGSFRLDRQWQVTLPSAFSRLAVCPDGKVYVTDFPVGRIITLDATLKTARDYPDPVPAAVFSMACTEDRLYTAGLTGQLRIFQRRPSLTLLSEVEPDVPFDQMVVAEPGLIIVNATAPRGRSRLAAIDDKGNLLYYFDGQTAGSGFWLSTQPAPRSLIWDDPIKCLLSLAPGSNRFQIYTPRGRYVGTKSLWAQSEVFPAAGSAVHEGAAGAARLANGNFVVQTQAVQPSTRWAPPPPPATFLRVFDSKLNPMGDAIDSEPGGLKGASPQGDLYFVTSIGQKLILTKSRLVDSRQN